MTRKKCDVLRRLDDIIYYVRERRDSTPYENEKGDYNSILSLLREAQRKAEQIGWD
jgi:hypothetical protein